MAREVVCLDTMPLVVLLFYAVPEGVLSCTIGLILVNVRPRLKQMIIFGILFALSAYLSRRFLPIPGFHAIVITLCVSVYLTFLYGISYKKALIASLFSLIFVALGEALFMTVTLSFSGLTIEQILANQWLRVLVTLPQQLLLAAIVVISYRLRRFHLDRYRYPSTYRPWGAQ
jgi:hypothetical protein